MNEELKTRVIEEVRRYIEKFNSVIKSGARVEMCDVEFTSKLGTNSGIAHGSRLIEFNSVLLAENVEKFITTTVPHEVAHICASKAFPNAKQGHGPEWRAIMRCFGVQPSRCHSYDVSNVERKRDMTKHLFTCKCNTQHLLSPQRAKNVKSFVCNKCRSALKYVAHGKESTLRQKYNKQ